MAGESIHASRPWSTGASGGGNGSCGKRDSCGSGSRASSTPAVAASSSALPEAMSDAPVKLSWASVGHDIKEAKGVQERLGRDCQRLASKIFDKKNKNTMIL